jgi:hypothetical protein
MGGRGLCIIETVIIDGRRRTIYNGTAIIDRRWCNYNSTEIADGRGLSIFYNGTVIIDGRDSLACNIYNSPENIDKNGGTDL